MSKIVKSGLLSVIMVTLGLGIFVFSAEASNGQNNLDGIPQKNGIYDVPNHPNMKVKVFVHYPKNLGKPGPPPSPTCSDDPSDSIVSAAGWHLPENWTYTLNPASVPKSVGGSNLDAIAQNSFGVWSNAIGGKVAFTQSGTSTQTKANSDDGVNLISWGRTPNNALAITYTMYYTSGPMAGTVAGVDTIMNSRMNWSWNKCSANSYDVQNILTHELGHWMGLDDEYASNFANNTMYGYGTTAEMKKDTLSNGDILGVLNVYPL